MLYACQTSRFSHFQTPSGRRGGFAEPFLQSLIRRINSSTIPGVSDFHSLSTGRARHLEEDRQADLDTRSLQGTTVTSQVIPTALNR